MRTILTGLIIVMFSIASFASTKHRWELHDVSILFPLPTTLENNLLARTTDLLPKMWTDLFPRLSIRYDQPTMLRQSTIVGLRIDASTNQVKLVWQPVMPNGTKGMTTIDAAFHSFYQLSPTDYELFTAELFQYVKTNTIESYSADPLNIHPLFIQQNSELTQTHLRFFKVLIEKHLNSKNIFKVTAMVLRGNDDMWAFMGFETKGVAPVAIEIPLTNNSPVQTFINQAVPFDHFVNFRLNPLTSPTTDMFLDSLLGFSTKTENRETLTEDEIKNTIRSARRMENPSLVSVESMDCVSCHVTQPIIDQIRFSQKENFQDNDEVRYKNPDYNLKNIHTEINTRRIRGFGYFGNEPAISDRAINESAEAATIMNEKQNMNLNMNLKVNFSTSTNLILKKHSF